MLTQTLRQLEQDGLISRMVIPTVLVSVTYALTNLRQSFNVPARQMVNWAGKAYASIAEARQHMASGII